LQKSKYHIRVMRPTFERAILTVEASSEKAAMRAALEEAGRLTFGGQRLFHRTNLAAVPDGVGDCRYHTRLERGAVGHL
jgi:hypothetical protein